MHSHRAHRGGAHLEEAAEQAGRIGYPVVLKLFSETITHKTDVGGVQLNLADREAVERAWRRIQTSVTEKAGAQHFQGVTVQPMIKSGDGYELIIGSSLDAQFGPVLLFGTGGQLVEVFKDRALGLPPLNTTLARRMMEQTKIYKALKGVRGRKPVNLAELEQVMVRFSRLVVEQPWIKEIDINPLLATPERLVALDARIVVHGPEVGEGATAQARHPALSQPLRVDVDHEGWQPKSSSGRSARKTSRVMVKFHETLSERSVYLRYFHLMNLSQRVAHERLTRICFIDYDREMALVAERRKSAPARAGSWCRPADPNSRARNDAEVAVLVSDQFQGRGLGKELLARLVVVGRDEKLGALKADILPDNRDVMRVCEKLGFTLRHSMEDEVVKAEFRY